LFDIGVHLTAFLGEQWAASASAPGKYLVDVYQLCAVDRQSICAGTVQCRVLHPNSQKLSYRAHRARLHNTICTGAGAYRRSGEFSAEN
jgi:hypothetical protein